MHTAGDGQQSPPAPSNMCTDGNHGRSSTKTKGDLSSNTKVDMHLTHSPTRLFNVIANLKASQPHIDAIRAMGFGGLIQMPNISLRKNMLQDIADAYQVIHRGFKLCGEIVTIQPSDVQNIMSLQITGIDVDDYIKHNMQNRDRTKDSELFKRFANDKQKLDIPWLEKMLDKERPADDDFKRAFVLFTIGVILASPTGSDINWSYIELVRDVSKIPYFNWGHFTLNHLLNSCQSFKNKSERTLKGNLVLLQCWYWERVRVPSHYQIDYSKMTNQPPLMVFWDKDNADRRTTAYIKNGINGGTLNIPLASHNTNKKKETMEASMSEAKHAQSAHEGPSTQEVQSLDNWKKAIKRELLLELETKVLEMGYNQDKKYLEQKKEFASFSNESILEDRLNRLEAKIVADNERMSAEIKEIRQLVRSLIEKSSCQSAIVQPPMPSSATVQPPVPSSVTVQPHMSRRSHFQEKTMEQLGDPPTPHIKPREPIIDNDYETGAIDAQAAMFVIYSYKDARVVQMDHLILTAGQLRRNVSEEYIEDEVINAYVHFSNVENDSASFFTTFDVKRLVDRNWKQSDSFKKKISEKCKGRHLVFVPMNINDNHWGLLVLNFIKKEVQILESLGIRNKKLEKALVEGIQSCIDSSIITGLIKFEYPFNLREWEINAYLDIPKQENSFSCAAFVIQYILAWDGEKMAHHFTTVEMECFSYRMCTRLLHSDRNKIRLKSYEKPITKEVYLEENPDERERNGHDEDTDDLQILSPPTGTAGNGEANVTTNAEANTTSLLEKTKRGRGRPRKIQVESNSTPGGSVKVSGAPSRKRRRPSKIKVDTAPHSVVHEFSTDAIAKRIPKRQSYPGKQQVSPYKSF